MFVADLHFDGPAERLEAAAREVGFLLGAMRMNGQLTGREHATARVASGLRVTVLVPEEASLDEKNANLYVRQSLARLVERFEVRPRVTIVGTAPDGVTADECSPPSALVLFTNYVSLESPVRCLEHFRPVALHRIPPTPKEEHDELVSWESDYQACDSLQMNCATAEQSSVREMSDVNSSLMSRARALCRRVEQNTGIPTYAYLFSPSADSMEAARARRCPSCGAAWRLERPLHGLLEFKCTACRLVSNLPFDIAG